MAVEVKGLGCIARVTGELTLVVLVQFAYMERQRIRERTAASRVRRGRRLQPRARLIAVKRYSADLNRATRRPWHRTGLALLQQRSPSVARHHIQTGVLGRLALLVSPLRGDIEVEAEHVYCDLTGLVFLGSKDEAMFSSVPAPLVP